MEKMKTTVFSMVVATSASTDAAAQIQIPRRGFITGWHLKLDTVDTTNGNAHNFELSLTPAYQGATNDALQTLDIVGLGVVNLTAIGVFKYLSDSVAVTGLAIPVEAGTRVYINTNQAATAQTNIAKVFFSE